MATKKTTPQDVTLGILKNTSKIVDFTKMIDDQREFVSKAKRIAGSKPSKVEQAYIDEQQTKLNQLEDIVKNWIYEAYEDDDKLYDKVVTWTKLINNFSITVVVEKL